MPRQKKIAFQGEPGANSHIACNEVFPAAEAVPHPTFEDCFVAVEKGKADLGMIPIENSLHGRITDIHHLLPTSGLHIVGEHFLPIHFQLMGLPGTGIADIRSVHSHIHALGQCRKIIREHRWTAMITGDTAGAAREVAEWKDPTRTMLGDAQEQWLSDGLRTSKHRWQILGNQTMIAPFVGQNAGGNKTYAMDPWAGYPSASERLLSSIAKHAPNRTVAITGDIHSNWVNELHDGFARDDRPIVAAEFVGTSITSGGDGADRGGQVTPSAMSNNPHLKWQNSRRGYVVCRVDANVWNTEYRTVPYVTRPGAPLETPTKWRVENGRAGIEPA